MTTFNLADLVQAHGQYVRISDIDPDDCNALLVKVVREVRVGRDRIEMVERASLLRRYAMRLHAFALRVRDCGWRYAIAWPN
jgi:hypothetical protein